VFVLSQHRRGHAWWLGLAVVAVLGSACASAGQQLRRRASVDFECSQEGLQLIKIDSLTFKVTGCGQSGTYVRACGGYQCTWVLNSDVKEAPSVAESVATADAKDPPPEEARIDTTRAEDGSTKLKLYMKSYDWTLYFAATPRTDGKIATVVWRIPKTHQKKECEIKLVADGERIAIDEGVKLIERERSYDYQTTMPYDSLLALAKSVRIAGRLCGVEATLTEAQIDKIRELVVRIKEEHAWDEEPERNTTEAEAAPTEL
jgi:hypothetical protein